MATLRISEQHERVRMLQEVTGMESERRGAELLFRHAWDLEVSS